VRLAQDSLSVIGIDFSAAMLDVAREKSVGISNARWVEGDMKSFELDETFGLVIIPGYSFQFMLTPEDQIPRLECIKRHFAPSVMIVVHLDHQNLSWLEDLCKEKGGVFEMVEELMHPKTGCLIRTSRAWSYKPSMQTTSAVTVWEEISTAGDAPAIMQPSGY